MRIVNVDSTREKKILTGMILSSDFLRKIVPIFEYEYFDLAPAKEVTKWIIEYYGKYSVAPKVMIKEIFENKSRRLDNTTAEWIEEFLNGLSKDYEREGLNPDYLYDETTKFFRSQKLLKRSEKIKVLLEKEKVEEAETLWAESIKLEKVDENFIGVDPFSLDYILKTKEERNFEKIFTFGSRGLDILSGKIRKEWFVMFMGPMKRGKTQALTSVGIRAALIGLPTVIISLEQGLNDMSERMWMNYASLCSEDKATEIEFPVFKDKKAGTIKYVSRRRGTTKDDNSLIKAAKSFQRMAKAQLWLKVFPAYSANVDDIKRYLDILETQENFSPSVIVVDYLGALSPPRRLTGRDVYDVNSKMLKGLSGERKAIVFSAHQGNKKTLEKLNMEAQDVPEDVRILGNVDILYGLNQTEEEKNEGVMRINILMHRHRKFSPNSQVKILQQFEAGQFHLDDIIIKAPRLVDKKDDLVGEDQ